MMQLTFDIKKYHLATILLLVISATGWTIVSDRIWVSLLWFFWLLMLMVLSDLGGIRILLSRFLKISSVLLIVSMFQLIFRRSGEVVLEFQSHPLIYSDGLNQTILLWLRYMVIFEIAFLFSMVKIFDLFVFLSKLRISLRFNLLLLTAIRFLPYIAKQIKLAHWTMQFQGVRFSQVNFKQKMFLIKKMLKPILYAGFQYGAISSLALEMRGYGSVEKIILHKKYPLQAIDFSFISFILLANGVCFWAY